MRRAAIERSALAELSALSPPAGATAKQWEAMITQTKDALVDVTKLVDAAHASDAGAVTRELAATTRPRLGLLVAAVNAGAKSCIQLG